MALTGQHAGVLILQALVLAEQIADLTAANANITGGHVGVGADVAVQLGHKALAETHDLGIRLAVGVKVSAALAAAHGQAGQAVLEALLKAQELQDRQVDRGVETQAALVGTDGRVELDAVAAVDLDLASVIDPGHTEHDDALGLDKALDQAGFSYSGGQPQRAPGSRGLPQQPAETPSARGCALQGPHIRPAGKHSELP